MNKPTIYCSYCNIHVRNINRHNSSKQHIYNKSGIPSLLSELNKRDIHDTNTNQIICKICKKCDKNNNIHYKSTSNYNKHLQNIHKIMTINEYDSLLKLKKKDFMIKLKELESITDKPTTHKIIKTKLIEKITNNTNTNPSEIIHEEISDQISSYYNNYQKNASSSTELPKEIINLKNNISINFNATLTSNIQNLMNKT